MTDQSFSIAIIGAGFSGALLAVQLLRRCRPGDRVYLIERRAGFGRGLAYSTNNLNHLLNVRAGNMSAFQDQPGHFVDWLRQHGPDAADRQADADSFVSRRVYGSYVRSLLCEELWDGGKGRNLYLVPDQAVALNEDARGISLTVAGGTCYRLDMVVLAAGNLPPDETRGAYIGDPWHPAATAELPREASVLLIGSGLTMVDTVQSLLDAGHRGMIHVFSRRGLVPHAHAPARALELSAADLPRTTSIVRLMRWLRTHARAAETTGRDWRCVVDGLRPHIQDLWRRLPLEERRRFLRHLRPWWEVHRHRTAPAVAARLQAAIDRGQVRIGAGRVVSMTPDEVSVTVQVRRRRSCAVETFEVARVINCSGPETNFAACREPLIRDLMARRFVRPDPLGLGLEVSEQGALLNAVGQPSRRLFAVGPVTRGTFWEIVAVPDIRLQCARLAGHLVSTLEGMPRAFEPGRQAAPEVAAASAGRPVPQRVPQRLPILARPQTRGA